MPAITVDDIMVLPRLPRPDVTETQRPVRQIVTAARQQEGAGFEVTRPFPGIDLRSADPFILLDQMGAGGVRAGRGQGRAMATRTAASRR